MFIKWWFNCQIIGSFCVFFLAWNFWSYYRTNVELFFLCTAVSFLIGTSCLLVSCIFSLSTGGIISKTMYELIYHSVAFIFYLVASILLLLKNNDHRYSSTHPYMMASVWSKNEKEISPEFYHLNFNCFFAGPWPN